MRKRMRVLIGAVCVAGMSVAVMAGGRGGRTGKSDAVNFHLASSSPQAGFRQITTSDGHRVYVSPRATWTSLDVLSVDSTPGRSGETLSVRLSGSATSRLTDQVRRVSDTKVAIYSGNSMIALADVNQDGSLRVSGISADRSQQIRQVVESTPAIPAGPLVTVVPAGQVNGRYLVDVYLEGVEALRAYQFHLTAGGGDSGSLDLKDVTIDETRQDFAFHGSQTISANNALLGQLAAVRFDGPVPAVDAKYIGTYTFVPSRDAEGLFRVNVEPGEESVVVGARNNELPFNVGADARVFVGSSKSRRDDK